MKKLLLASVAIAIFCCTCLAPALSAQTPMHDMVTLFGYERSEKEDVVYFRNNDVLRGTVLNEAISIVTSYGDVSIPIRRCAGLSFEGSSTITEQVVTVNFNLFSGIIGNRVIKFKIGSSGETIEVRKEKIRYILLKRNINEGEFLGSGSITNLFVMTNGDLITGKPNPTQIVINTEYADVKVGLDEIKDVVMQGDNQITIVITKKNKDVLRGKLATEDLTLELDLGTSIEAVYKDRFAKIYVEVGKAQIATEFLEKKIGVSELPSTPMNPATTSKQDLAVIIPGAVQVQLKMKLIPAGTYLMGSPSGETDRSSTEGPQHQVTISKPFYMGMYEITQAQWGAVMGLNPALFGNLPNNPVEQVSWDDCQKFVQKINTMGIGTYRLPTEAEWEYACRAGSTSRFPWGDDPGYSLVGQHAWYDSNSNKKPQNVGLKIPNAWGLYDMSGNVWEWCSDWYASSYSAGAQTDPGGPSTGSSRVLRGGSWTHNSQSCRSAVRRGHSPQARISYYGFRLVKTIP